MILTCPQCATRYLLPAHTLAPEGRRVKCSNCTEVWFQLPDMDEMRTAQQEKFEDIPDGVKPLTEGSNLPTLQEEEEIEEKGRGRFMGYAAAATVFFAIFAALIAFHAPVLEKFPVARPLYAMLGYQFTSAGQNLSFDSLTADAAPDAAGEKISITGKIVNKTAKPETVPMIEAQMRDEAGEILERWVIRPPAEMVEAEADISFSTDYLIATPGAASAINLQFVPVQN